jgi:hypothetical protein
VYVSSSSLPAPAARLAAPQERADAGREHAGTEGLGDVVVGPALEAGDHVGLLALGREHHHGHVAGLGLALEPPADLQAVHRRQHEVENDQIRRLTTGGLERLLAAAHAVDAVALLREVVAHELEQILLVVDDEDQGGRQGVGGLRLRRHDEQSTGGTRPGKS